MTTTILGPDPELYNRMKALYDAADQSHVFTFYSTLTPTEQSALLNQLASIDVHRVNRIYSTAIAADHPITPPTQVLHLQDTDSLTVSSPNLIGRQTSRPATPDAHEILPLPEEACASILNNAAEESRWREAGLEAIANNTVAVLLMAGGQGTRLGSSDPKGMYDIHLPSGKSLFEYQAGRIKRLERVAAERAGKKVEDVSIRWYVMTSGPTRKHTEQYFKSKDYFGLRPDHVVFFEQGESFPVYYTTSTSDPVVPGVLPALSEQGKLLLSTPSSLSVAPDGNGGLYSALRQPLSPHSSRTVLSDLRAHNVAYIHAYCVDNCLVKVADPVFLGVCIERSAACGAKVVRKIEPTESVGVLVKKGDGFSVVEYSELSKEKSISRDANGQLTYRAANIANHFYTTAFLESVEQMERKMAFHIARKKIQTVDLATGETVKPVEPNGMKLELFVFDVFPFTTDLVVLEVDRAEEFSPLKNAPGSKADCPETSRRDLLAQQKRWLASAGAAFASDAVEVEVLPEVTYSGEGLEWVKGTTFSKSGVLAQKEDLEGLSST
ncbi:UDP-N-acetylglucosamine/UDP-N-acetylgalactosamine diphosphorylase, partial [Tremellales sp. Uapishka_1]